MLITLALHPGRAGAVRSPASCCSASSTSSSRTRPDASSVSMADSASWPTTRWRRSTRICRCGCCCGCACMAGVNHAPRSRRPKSLPSAASCSARPDRHQLAVPRGAPRSLGIELAARAVVGDDRARDSRRIFAAALSRADLVVLTGGLGPTDDDLTRDVVSDVLGLQMREDAAIVAQHREPLRAARPADARGEPSAGDWCPPAPCRSTIRTEPRPGLYIEHQGHVVVLLPGPPRELQPMFDGLCEGPLLERAGAERLFKEALFVAGRGESHVEEIAQPLYSRWTAEIAADRDDHPGDARTSRAAPDASGPRSRERARRARARRARNSQRRSATTSSARTGDRWRKSSARCSPSVR